MTKLNLKKPNQKYSLVTTYCTKIMILHQYIFTSILDSTLLNVTLQLVY